MSEEKKNNVSQINVHSESQFGKDADECIKHLISQSETKDKPKKQNDSKSSDNKPKK